MASELGKLIRETRQGQSLGLRELARRIGKSPAYLVSLERAEAPPGVSEDTLKALAAELKLDLDTLLVLAKKIPQELVPRSSTQVALYRLIRKLPAIRQEEIKKQLEREVQSQETEKRKPKIKGR